MMHINLCNNISQATMIGLSYVNLQTSINSGTTWTTSATAQNDVVSTVFSPNISLTEMVTVGANSWWQATVTNPNVGGTYAHYNATSAPTWIIHRVG